jgi:GntR family transcriptional regulator
MKLKIEPASPIPIYLQIIEKVRNGIVSGALGPDEELPSVRALAGQHLINPNTVARAYMELEREGLVEKRRGAGTYVAPQALKWRAKEKTRIVTALVDDAVRRALEFGMSSTEVRMLFIARLERLRDEPEAEKTEPRA